MCDSGDDFEVIDTLDFNCDAIVIKLKTISQEPFCKRFQEHLKRRCKEKGYENEPLIIVLADGSSIETLTAEQRHNLGWYTKEEFENDR